jgi:hypothetical protein
VEDEEGVHYVTVIDEVVKYYRNIYHRQTATKTKVYNPANFGFHVNRTTKPAIMACKRKAMRDFEYIEYSKEALDEADVMELLPNGVISAVEGAHDDIEVPTATALYISQTLPIPKLIPMQAGNTKYLRIIYDRSKFLMSSVFFLKIRGV